MKKGLIACLFIVLVFPSVLFSDEKKPKSQPLINGTEYVKWPSQIFRELESFGSIGIFFLSPPYGCNWRELHDYAALRYRNNFAGFPFIPLGDRSDILEIKGWWEKNRGKIGNIEIYVFIAGEDYPAPYHVKFKVKSYAPLVSEPYEDWTIGCSSKKTIQKDIEAAINYLMQRLAVQFHQTREAYK